MSERPPIIMHRRGAGLAPATLIDSAALERFPYGKGLKVRVSRDRSGPQLRLYFGLLDKIAENLDQDVNGDDLHEFLKMKLGYTRLIKLRNGRLAEVAASVAFDKMDQATFNDYFAAAKVMLTEYVIPALSLPDFEREVRAMLGVEPEQLSTSSNQGAGASNKRVGVAVG